MRKHTLSVLAAAAVGLTASMASAADLPRKAPPAAPPPPPPVLTWTGCYIGGNVGGVFTRVEANFDFGTISHDNSGFTGGGQIGCDYQWAGGWVIGFRNMFNGTSGSKDVTINGFGDRAFDNATISFKNQWFDALTGRLGYAWSPTWLMYFQGGAVWSKVEAEITGFGGGFCGFNNITCDFGSASKTRTGWTIGGGVEWRFAPQWSAFLEGNYYDFGDHNRNISTHNFFINTPGGFIGCDNGCGFNTQATAATVLVGVNYRWGGKAPYAAY
jgi:outer membrane immunogenic protein